MPPPSPRITGLSWGSITVAGLGEFKDAKLWPGGGEEWDWGETGTRHSPGIQPADAEALVAAGATAVVLSQGVQERLGVPAATVAWLREQGVEVHVAATERAVEIYNALTATTPVGGLFHSTC